MRTVQRKGATLLEVITVSAIVMVLIACLGLALAPIANAKSLESQIRTDLKQFASAINIYMADNDDNYPLSLSEVRGCPPQKVRGWNKTVEQYGQIGEAWYYYTNNWALRSRIESFGSKVVFSPEEFSIVDAQFYARRVGIVRSVKVPSDSGEDIRSTVACREILAVWLDGNIRWKLDPDDWAVEGANTFLREDLNRRK